MRQHENIISREETALNASEETDEGHFGNLEEEQADDHAIRTAVEVVNEAGTVMPIMFFFSSRRRHTRLQGDWSSDVCSSDLQCPVSYHSTTFPGGTRSMADPFHSSDEYDERAHQLYNEGQYDEAIDTLREGLGLYPHSVELHVGMGYARLAREEFAWARRAFEEAHGLDPDHEDTLAGLGEVLLKFGERAAALACFERVLALGFQDDHDLMLQIGRALFREAVLDQARRFFEGALNAHPDSADAAACVGYAPHRRAH